MPGGEIRREHGYQTRPGDAEGAGAAPTAGGGAAAAGCTAGRGCSLGRVDATVGDALGPTTRAGRFAGFTTCGAHWATAHSDGPATRAAGEAPQGGGAGGRVCHGHVEAAADWGVDPARVWGAPGGEFGVADPAADGLEPATPDEPRPATEYGGSEAMEADRVALPQQDASRQGLLIDFIDESGVTGLSLHARGIPHRRVLPETSVRVGLQHRAEMARSSRALKAACAIRPPRATTAAAIPAAA